MDATTDERIKEVQAKIAELKKDYAEFKKLSTKNDKYIPLMTSTQERLTKHEDKLDKCKWLWGILDVDSNPH